MKIDLELPCRLKQKHTQKQKITNKPENTHTLYLQVKSFVDDSLWHEILDMGAVLFAGYVKPEGGLVHHLTATGYLEINFVKHKEILFTLCSCRFVLSDYYELTLLTKIAYWGTYYLGNKN